MHNQVIRIVVQDDIILITFLIVLQLLIFLNIENMSLHNLDLNEFNFSYEQYTQIYSA